MIFVRHALPGERVLIAVTDDSHDRFWRADAVEVLEPSPDRVEPPLPDRRSGLCGGCDFQHVDLAAQRRLKSRWWPSSCDRLAGHRLGRRGGARSTPPGTEDGLHWRTRMRYQVDDEGRAGLRAHRSHEVIAVAAGGARSPTRVRRRSPAGLAAGRRADRRATSTGRTALFEAGPHGASPLDRAGRRPRLAGRRRRLLAGASGRRPDPGRRRDRRAGAAAGGAGLRPLLRRRAVRRRAGRRRLPGLGVESSRPGDRDARQNLRDVADRVRLHRRPGGARSRAGCRAGPTWSCSTRRAPAPARTVDHAVTRAPPAGDRVRRLRPGRPGPRPRHRRRPGLPRRSASARSTCSR